MVQIVEIRQRGFSVRYPHNVFVAKYGAIVGRGPDQPGFQGPGKDEQVGPAAWRDEAERVRFEGTTEEVSCSCCHYNPSARLVVRNYLKNSPK